LAGVTAMVSKNSPMPAARRVTGIKMPTAPNSSNTPLIKTAARGQGMDGGTIRISSSVSEKCATPPIMNHKNTKTKATRRNTGIMATVATVFGAGNFVTSIGLSNA